MLRIGMAVVLCAAVGGLAGCGASKSTPSGGTGGGDAGGAKKASPLVGTWEATVPEAKGITLVLAFTADGKFTQETVLEGVPKADNVTVDGGKQEGTYTLEDKALALTAGGKDRKMTVKGLTDAKLVLANPDGMELTFSKKK